MNTSWRSSPGRTTWSKMGLSAACVTIGTVALAQGYMTFEGRCNYAGDDFEETIWTYDPNEGARHALNRIMKHTGLPTNFALLGGNVDNAEASIKDGIRYIVYSPSFMEGVESGTNTNWSSVSVLAHEVGHHLAGHTLDGLGSRPDQELEADKFSGFVLCKMGASLEQAKAAMSLIAHSDASFTHPGRAARLKAIAEGWNEAVAQGGGSMDDTRIAMPAGRIKRTWVEHNVWWMGRPGMRIHADFEVDRGKGRDGQLAAYFSFANGVRLRDYNGWYRTTEGNVAHHEPFKPRYDDAQFDDFILWMPYDELHLACGMHHVKFNLVLSQKSTSGKQVQLAKSKDIVFPLSSF